MYGAYLQSRYFASEKLNHVPVARVCVREAAMGSWLKFGFYFRSFPPYFVGGVVTCD